MRILLLIVLLGLSKSIYACHGMALVSPSVTMNSTSLLINASSDPAAWMCGPYTMQVELSYTGTFTGTPPQGFSNPAWQTFPFYHSLLNIPNYGPPQWNDGAVLEPYETIWIDFIYLCPGSTVYLRMREYVEASASPGPWSTPFSVTIPGTPVLLSGSIFASDTVICPGDSAQLHVTHNGCSGNYSVSWLPVAGLSDAFNDTTSAAPSMVTTYTVTVTDLTFNQTFNSLVTVYPDSCLTTNVADVQSGIFTVLYESDYQRILVRGQTPGSLQIYSAEGRLCYRKDETSEPELTVSTNGWSRGVYFVETVGGTQRSVQRIVVY
ncbi:MAG: hypothetical protein RL007_70 [Bacteroidota bacterium]|jgi:hypothetical protein